MSRFSISQENVAIYGLSSIADSDEISYGEFEKGTIHVPNGEAVVTLTFHTSHKLGGEYEAAHDDNDSAVTLTVAANRSYPIPTELAGAVALKITGDVAGTLQLSLKA